MLKSLCVLFFFTGLALANDKLLTLYQQFHKIPELSFKEEKTSLLFAAKLEETGFTVTSKVGGYGVVGLLKNGKGKTVLLRTDLDALPVEEKTGLPFASTVKTKMPDGSEVSVMHACGHDVHMTNMIGVAEYLASHKDKWQGTVVIIGQPAEERGGGAQAMLADGLYTRFPKPDYALALHVDATLETGKVSLLGGPVMATADSIDITLWGKGGHGAVPQDTIDPVALASHFIVDLQNVISRERAPNDSSVISVGSLHCGTKHNIISDNCRLQLTVRSFTEGERKKLFAAITRKAKAAALSFGAPEPEVKFSVDSTPSLVNDPGLVKKIVPVLESAVGKENVVDGSRVTVSEDFSRYAVEGVPIAMFRLGSINAKRFKKIVPGLHSSGYYPDIEPTLKTGISAMSAAAISLLQP